MFKDEYIYSAYASSDSYTRSGIYTGSRSSSASVVGSSILSTRPPARQNDGRKSKGQERFEGMNRRERMDRKFGDATAETDHEIEELNAEKLREEDRRLEWDLDWFDRVTASADNTNADPTALSVPITSEELRAPETPDIRNSKSGRGLAEFFKFLLKPWRRLGKFHALRRRKGNGKE